MGDFNYSDINWVDIDAVGKEGQEFVKLVYDCFLIQHVHSPKRGKNILYLVMTTEPDVVENIKIQSQISNSDHNLLSWIFKYWAINQKSRQDLYSYMRGDYIKVTKFLKAVNWEEEFKFKTVKECSLVFKTKLESRNKYVPFRKLPKRKFPAWVSTGIITGINKKNKAWNEYNKIPNYLNQNKYKMLFNKVTDMIQKLK